jgi:hypothetical protein
LLATPPVISPSFLCCCAKTAAVVLIHLHKLVGFARIGRTVGSVRPRSDNKAVQYSLSYNTAAIGAVGASSLFCPQFFWRAPDSYQALYERITEYLELETRVEVLNARFTVSWGGMELEPGASSLYSTRAGMQERADGRVHGWRIGYKKCNSCWRQGHVTAIQ